MYNVYVYLLEEINTVYMLYLMIFMHTGLQKRGNTDLHVHVHATLQYGKSTWKM